MKFNFSRKQTLPSKNGFTLIELLVVVAIIGILASVVLASLNSARVRGQEAAIKSDLKNAISQAELSYSNVSPNNYSNACAEVSNMISGINSTGATAACYSNNNPTYSDINLRWGATARNSNGTKNWSADSNGVVEWGTSNLGSTSTVWNVPSGATAMGFDTASAVCAGVGGRLPSLEELKALYDVYDTTPTGFSTSNYWSSTTVPSISVYAYVVNMASGTGVVDVKVKTNGYFVRCVR